MTPQTLGLAAGLLGGINSKSVIIEADPANVCASTGMFLPDGADVTTAVEVATSALERFAL